MAVIVHALAAGAVWLSSAPIAGELLATIAIAMSYWRIRQSFTGSTSCGYLCYTATQGWSVEGEGGAATEPVDIMSTTVVTPWMVFLHARSAHMVQTWVVCEDTADPDTFRRLRVCLRTGPVQSHPAAGIKSGIARFFRER